MAHSRTTVSRSGCLAQQLVPVPGGINGTAVALANYGLALDVSLKQRLNYCSLAAWRRGEMHIQRYSMWATTEPLSLESDTKAKPSAATISFYSSRHGE